MSAPHETTTASRYSGWQVAFFILLAVVLSVALSLFIAYRFLFPVAFAPTTLNSSEQQVLQAKLQQLEGGASAGSGQRLEPEAYTEREASRSINFSEKELNALLVSSPELAQRLAIDLSDNLASANLLVPVPPDFPVLGGKTVRVNAGLQLSFANGRPQVVLQGLSLWGVPVPNAWLGGIKNVDLVEQFGNDPGFWRAFADGVESIAVEDGELHLVLKE